MLKIELTGHEKLLGELKDAQVALSSLDGTITTLTIKPDDPSSVQEAIETMETEIDKRVAPLGHNALVASVVKASKDHYRAKILELVNKKPRG
ncbi:MAG: hypothetical protein WCD49_09220 [Candidatus Acidiferrales bacterium]